MKVTAKLKNLRISPRKVRLVADSIKGMNAANAIAHVHKTIKRSSDDFEKLIRSAVANAENNFGLDGDNMYVSDVQVGEGPSMKRWLPRAHGRATSLIKRTSHVYLELSEREEGKNRKSSEQLEKEREERLKAKAKAIKEFEEEMKNEEESEDEQHDEKEAKDQKVKKEAGKKMQKGEGKGWKGKIFQRKSV